VQTEVPPPIRVPESIHDVDNGKILGFGADLSEDHPVGEESSSVCIFFWDYEDGFVSFTDKNLGPLSRRQYKGLGRYSFLYICILCGCTV
jgi:hypothetical protein